MKEIKVGDVATVEFTRNVNGGKPVCRIEGVIGFIVSNNTEFVAPMSVWTVEVVAVNSKSVVVNPIEKVKSAWVNMREISMKMMDLVNRVEKATKPKQHVHYPFLSNTERKAL